MSAIVISFDARRCRCGCNEWLARAVVTIGGKPVRNYECPRSFASVDALRSECGVIGDLLIEELRAVGAKVVDVDMTRVPRQGMAQA